MPPTEEVAKINLLVLAEWVMFTLYHTCVYVANMSTLGVRDSPC